MKAIDYLGAQTDPNKKPCEIEIKEAFGKNANLIYCTKNKCWSVERSVRGITAFGVFTPHPFQSVKYKIRL